MGKTLNVVLELPSKNGASFNTSFVGATLTRGAFGTLKFVINRGIDEARYSYYWNGQPGEANSFTKYPSGTATEFDGIRFYVNKRAAGEDFAIYIDNLKVYTQ